MSEGLTPDNKEAKKFETKQRLQVFVERGLIKGEVRSPDIAKKLLGLSENCTLKDLDESVSATNAVVGEFGNSKTRMSLMERIEEARVIMAANIGTAAEAVSVQEPAEGPSSKPEPAASVGEPVSTEIVEATGSAAQSPVSEGMTEAVSDLESEGTAPKEAKVDGGRVKRNIRNYFAPNSNYNMPEESSLSDLGSLEFLLGLQEGYDDDDILAAEKIAQEELATISVEDDELEDKQEKLSKLGQFVFDAADALSENIMEQRREEDFTPKAVETDVAGTEGNNEKVDTKEAKFDPEKIKTLKYYFEPFSGYEIPEDVNNVDQGTLESLLGLEEGYDEEDVIAAYWIAKDEIQKISGDDETKEKLINYISVAYNVLSRKVTSEREGLNVIEEAPVTEAAGTEPKEQKYSERFIRNGVNMYIKDYQGGNDPRNFYLSENNRDMHDIVSLAEVFNLTEGWILDDLDASYADAIDELNNTEAITDDEKERKEELRIFLLEVKNKLEEGFKTPVPEDVPSVEPESAPPPINEVKKEEPELDDEAKKAKLGMRELIDSYLMNNLDDDARAKFAAGLANPDFLLAMLGLSEGFTQEQLNARYDMFVAVMDEYRDNENYLKIREELGSAALEGFNKITENLTSEKESQYRESVEGTNEEVLLNFREIVKNNNVDSLKDPESLRAVLGLPEEFTAEELSEKLEYMSKMLQSPEFDEVRVEATEAINESLAKLKSKESKEAEAMSEKFDRDYERYVAELNEKAEKKGWQKHLQRYLKNAPVRMAFGVVTGLTAAAFQRPSVRLAAILVRTGLASFGFGTAAEAGKIARFQRESVSIFADCKGEDGKYDREKALGIFRQLPEEEQDRVMASLAETTERRSEKVSEELYQKEQEAIAEAESKRGWLKERFDNLRDGFSKLPTIKKVAVGAAVALVSATAGITAGVIGGAAVTGGLSFAGIGSLLSAGGTVWGIGVGGLVSVGAGAVTSTREKMSNVSEHSELINILGQEYFQQENFSLERLQGARAQVGKEIVGSRKRGIALGIVVANAALILSTGARAMGRHPAGETVPDSGGEKGKTGTPGFGDDHDKSSSVDSDRLRTKPLIPGHEYDHARNPQGKVDANAPIAPYKGADVASPDKAEVTITEVPGFESKSHAGHAPDLSDDGKHLDAGAGAPAAIEHKGTGSIPAEQLAKNPTLHVKDTYFAKGPDGKYLHIENVGAKSDKHLAQIILKEYEDRTGGNFDKHELEAARDYMVKEWHDKGYFGADGSLKADPNDLKYDINALGEAKTAVSATEGLASSGHGKAMPDHVTRHAAAPREELARATGGNVPSTLKVEHDLGAYDKGRSITELGTTESLKDKQISKESLNYIDKMFKAGTLKPENVHVSADGKQLLVNMPNPGAEDTVWSTEIKGKSMFSNLFGRTADIGSIIPDQGNGSSNTLGNPEIAPPENKFAHPTIEDSGEKLTFKATDEPTVQDAQAPVGEEKSYVAVDDPNQNGHVSTPEVSPGAAGTSSSFENLGSQDVAYSPDVLRNIDTSRNYVVNIQGQEPMSVPGAKMSQLIEEAKKYFLDHHATFNNPVQENKSINLYILDQLKKK